MSYGGRYPYLIQSDNINLQVLDIEQGKQYIIPEDIVNAFLYQILLENRTDDLIERIIKGKEKYGHLYEEHESEDVKELLLRGK